MRASAALFATLFTALSSMAPLAAQDHDHHQHHGNDAAWQPEQGGQAAFAALQEIVARLEADPHTDWSAVDVGALREHLVDMNELVLYAEAVETPLPGGLEMRVSGPPRALAAVQRMVPAHARFLDARVGWSASAESGGNYVLLTVVADDPGGEQKIRALGFFGLMATEDHHAAHHWGMVRGEAMH